MIYLKKKMIFICLLMVVESYGNCIKTNLIEPINEVNQSLGHKVTATVTGGLVGKIFELSCISTFKSPLICNVINNATKALISGLVLEGLEDGVRWELIKQKDVAKINIYTESEVDAIIAASIFEEQKISFTKGKNCGVDWSSINLPKSCRNLSSQINAIGKAYTTVTNSRAIISGTDLSTDKIEDIKDSFDIPFKESILLYVKLKSILSANGLAITERGIYWKNNSYSSDRFFSWDDFQSKKYAIYSDDGYVVFEYDCPSFFNEDKRCDSKFTSSWGDFKAYQIAGMLNDLSSFVVKNKENKRLVQDLIPHLEVDVLYSDSTSSISFDYNKLTYIYWEIFAEDYTANKNIGLSGQVIWINKSEDTKEFQDFDILWEKGKKLYKSVGFGNKKIGASWNKGEYELQFYIEGIKVGQKSFLVE